MADLIGDYKWMPNPCTASSNMFKDSVDTASCNKKCWKLEDGSKRKTSLKGELKVPIPSLLSDHTSSLHNKWFKYGPIMLVLIFRSENVFLLYLNTRFDPSLFLKLNISGRYTILFEQ